jgi:ABC-type multidrug transport system fused ATPase/permease subunit
LRRAGKSTLVKLLCRLYDPDRGRITWDSIDLREMDPISLRDRISVVFQDYMAYDLTAADNIAVGDTVEARSCVTALARKTAGETAAHLPGDGHDKAHRVRDEVLGVMIRTLPGDAQQPGAVRRPGAQLFTAD